jgi:hypothetical protein
MAIDAVSRAIADLIAASLANAPGLSPGAFTIGFALDGANAHLILFPYVITPAPELRNAERLRPDPDDADALRRFDPAVPVELHYLVTTGAELGASETGFALLAGAIRALEQASPLAAPSAFQAAVWLSLLPMTSDEMSRIWGLFPSQDARPSLAFRASPVWIDPRLPVEPAQPVTSDTASAARRPEAVQ